MLEDSETQVRCMAFVILYNIFAYLTASKSTIPVVINFLLVAPWMEKDILQKFMYMASKMYYSAESDVNVWRTAVLVFVLLYKHLSIHENPNNKNQLKCNCDLYVHIFVQFTSFPSTVIVSVPVLGKFIQIAKSQYRIADMYNTLMMVLVNSLYNKYSIGQNIVEIRLNMQKTRTLDDGINFIIDQYLDAHSADVKSNCFTVILDYIFEQMQAKSKIEPSVAEVLYEVLKRADAHMYFTQLFRFLPDKYTVIIVNSIDLYKRFLDLFMWTCC